MAIDTKMTNAIAACFFVSRMFLKKVFLKRKIISEHFYILGHFFESRVISEVHSFRIVIYRPGIALAAQVINLCFPFALVKINNLFTLFSSVVLSNLAILIYYNSFEKRL